MINTRTYESKVVLYRYTNLVAIVCLIAFLVWWSPDLTSSAFYFLVAIIGYMAFVTTKAWFSEREFFGRTGPIDRVFSCTASGSENDATNRRN